jgi:hypothetical protein
LIRETGFDWDNNEVVKQRNKEMKHARFMGFFPLPSEDRVEKNARLGYRLGEGSSRGSREQGIISPCKLAVNGLPTDFAEL